MLTQETPRHSVIQKRQQIAGKRYDVVFKRIVLSAADNSCLSAKLSPRTHPSPEDAPQNRNSHPARDSLGSIFAVVMGVVVAGALAIRSLPISRYPQISPPSVSATYPGASAQTVQHSVTQIIEQKLTGFDGHQVGRQSADRAGAGIRGR